MASAMAISSCRRTPCAMADTGVSSIAASPTRSSACRAGPVSAAFASAGRQNEKLWPLTAWTASITFSRAVNSANTDVIWNERAKPASARRNGGSVVMSTPSKTILPSLGVSSPDSWLMSVVLPAPFGPMIA